MNIIVEHSIVLLTIFVGHEDGIHRSNIGVQAFTQTLLCTAVFPQRLIFFTVCLVNYLCEVLPWLAPKGKFLMYMSPDCWKMHF